MLNISNPKTAFVKSRKAGKKNLPLIIAIVICIFLLHSCGSKNKSKIELTPEMEGFMDMLDGKYESVDAAIQKYRSSDTIATQDMDIKDLQDPEVQDGEVSGTKTCFDLKVNDKAKDCIYELCWENGKIISITDKTAQ